MGSFSELMQQGAAHAWLFIPSAILLGALHGLEPGHSKTMMAAFIVAVRGTIFQAVLLGLAATFSHTLVVWGVALSGMYIFKDLDPETTEPYFQLVAAVIIIGIASWMFRQTWQDQRAAKARLAYREKAQSNQNRVIDTGHGLVDLMLSDEGGDTRFRAKFKNTRGMDRKPPPAGELVLETVHEDGTRQKYNFVSRGDHLESATPVLTPIDFDIVLTWDHDDHEHVYYESFRPAGAAKGQLDLGDMEAMDAHARSHAEDIQKRFAGRNVTTWQVVLFGLTGGLIPCPAAITVLLLCIQLKEFSLGAVLVVCFSIGLAITLVAVGATAAIGVRHATKRMGGWFSTLAARAPYFSSALIILVGLYTGYHGWMGLRAQHTASIEQQSIAQVSNGQDVRR